MANYNKSSYHGEVNPIHETEHRREWTETAIEKINELVPPMIEEYCKSMIESMISAISYDVRTCVDIAFDDAGDIFHSEKARQFVSDRISREIISHLKDIEVEVKLF